MDTILSPSELDSEVQRLQTVLFKSISKWRKPVVKRYAEILTNSSIDPDSSLEDLVQIITGPVQTTTNPPTAVSSSSTSTSVRKGQKVSAEIQTFVQTTPHSSIQIGERVISREEILGMNAKELKDLFIKAQPRSAVPKKKEDMILELWDISSKQNDRVLAQQMQKACQVQRSETDRRTLQEALPFVFLYREHFASIDRVDQFLSYLDTSISTKTAEVRLAERMFMCGISNARTWYCEQYSARKKDQSSSPIRPALAWGRAVVEVFFRWADNARIQE